MNNGDGIRSLNNEQLAEFLANERYRIANVIFEKFGFGIEKQIIYARILSFLNADIEDDGEHNG